MISDKKDYELLAVRADGRSLFLFLGAFYIESTHKLDQVSLSDDAYDKLERHGEIRQLLVCKTHVAELFQDQTSSEVDSLMQLIQPKIIEFWKEGKLAWIES